MSEPRSEPRSLEARVLWGRVATAVVVVLIAFGAGRCTAGGVPEDEVAELEGQVTALQSANDDLRSQVSDLDEQLREAPAVTPTPSPSPAEPTATEPSAPDPVEGAAGGTWTVESGDTLHAIAIAVYGDRTKAQLIAEANGLQPGATLQIGQVLQLPPEE